MEYTNSIVRNGKRITLTEEEVENIYRFQERKYRLSDARHHVNDWILRYTNRKDDDAWNLDASTISDKDLSDNLSEKDICKFHTLLSISDDDLEYLSDKFQSSFDCNCDENTLWDFIIADYLEETYD